MDKHFKCYTISRIHICLVILVKPQGATEDGQRVTCGSAAKCLKLQVVQEKSYKLLLCCIMWHAHTAMLLAWMLGGTMYFPWIDVLNGRAWKLKKSLSVLLYSNVLVLYYSNHLRKHRIKLINALPPDCCQGHGLCSWAKTVLSPNSYWSAELGNQC